MTDSSAILSEIATGDLPEHLRAGFLIYEPSVSTHWEITSVHIAVLKK